jgi:orotate phosphoribosyltransferase
MHSSGFFNGRRIIADEPFLQEVVADLVDQFILKGGDIKRVDRVVGPQTGGRKLAEFIADEISRRRDKVCYWASPANSNWGGTRTMVFEDPDHSVRPGENILLTDDVINTGGSIELTAQACEETDGVILPQLLCLVNRSGRQGVFGKLIVSLVDYPMPAWAAAGCEMCRTGSEAIPPKDPANWARLNAQY